MTFEILKLRVETYGKEIETRGGEVVKVASSGYFYARCLIQERAGCEHYSGEAGDGKIFGYRIREDLYDVRRQETEFS